jgi:hypothetical protein
MMLTRTVLFAAIVLTMSTPLMAAKVPTEQEKLRAEAEHVCYDDAQKLCPDAVPDEAKVTACMKAKKAKLSPACRKVFDRGMGM